MQGKRRQFSTLEKARAVERVTELVEIGHTTVDACRTAGIARSQYYRWKEQYERLDAGDEQALSPKSRRPRKFARQTPDNVRDQLVESARSGRFRSANALAETIRRDGYKIHAATVIGVLEAAGLYGAIRVVDDHGKFVRKKRGIVVADSVPPDREHEGISVCSPQ